MINKLNSNLPIRVLHLGIIATAISLGVVIWQLSLHIATGGEVGSMGMFGHFIHVVGDIVLLLPMALLVIVIGLLFSARLGLDFRNWSGIVGSASIISVLFFLGTVPGVSVHGFSHVYADGVVEGFSESPSVNPDRGMKAEMLMTRINMSETAFHGLHDAAVSQIIVLPMTILGLLLLSRTGNLTNYVRRQEHRKGSQPVNEQYSSETP